MEHRTNAFDMHCDTLGAIREGMKEGKIIDFERNDLQVDLAGLEKAGYGLQTFAAFVHLPSEEDPLMAALEMIDLFHRLMKKYPERIGAVRTYKDLEENEKRNRISALLSVEEGQACKGNLSALRMFYELGVRMMTLTWNFENDLAFPNRVSPDGCTPDLRGLKEKGIEFVREMERLGILVDVSHLSDGGFWDVAKYTTKPFITSHSNARALCPHVRNLTDEMLRTLGERGGVAGLNFCASFLEEGKSGQEPFGTVKRMADHLEYMGRIAGLEALALGTDFDGIPRTVEIEDCSGMDRLWNELKKRQFSEDAIEKIFSKNLKRVLKEVLH